MFQNEVHVFVARSTAPLDPKNKERRLIIRNGYTGRDFHESVTFWFWICLLVLLRLPRF